MQIEKINTLADIDLENHIFLSKAEEINNIIKPLTDSFGLNTFNYHKTYTDNSYQFLTNIPAWRRHYSLNRLYQKSVFELPAHTYVKSRIITSNLDTHSVVLLEASKFGIKSVITFVEPVDDGCEFYFLGSSSDNKTIINKCLSNFFLLEKFIANFHNMAKDIFTEIRPYRLIVKDRMKNNLSFNLDDNIDKFNFLSLIYNYHFTQREIDCIPLLMKGYSAKQIAENLGLSFRTIEMYINNLKEKTNTTNKIELVTLLTDKFA